MLEDVNTDKLMPGHELDSIIARILSANVLTVPFSTDIAFAWILVEKYRLCVWPTKDKRWLVIQDEFYVVYGDEYWFDSWALEECDYSTFRASAPWAICIAVVKLAQQGKT